jgi:hypothetical protein
MWTPLSSRSRNARQLRLFRIASTALCLSLGIASPSSAIAQAVPSSLQPIFDAAAEASPDLGFKQHAGIPLGATEIAIPGVSPILPSQNTGMANCGGARSSGALFDGGALSGSTSLSCADSGQPPSSTVARAGIPLGATELGNAGTSLALPAPSSNR